jgi:hypothetical protein
VHPAWMQLLVMKRAAVRLVEDTVRRRSSSALRTLAGGTYARRCGCLRGSSRFRQRTTKSFRRKGVVISTASVFSIGPVWAYTESKLAPGRDGPAPATANAATLYVCGPTTVRRRTRRTGDRGAVIRATISWSGSHGHRGRPTMQLRVLKRLTGKGDRPGMSHAS